jgi:cytochrome c oxidase assembly protein subunit 15
LLSGAISLRQRYLYEDFFSVSATTKLLKNIYLYLVIALIVVGTITTGSGPLAGDLAAKRYPFDVANVARLHSYIGISVLITLIGLWISIRLYENEEVRSALSQLLFATLGVLIIQGAIGYRQFALGLPEILVGLHIFGSALIWALSWNLHLRLRNS